jgi:calcium/calmodulin-dependent protein kinase I
MKMMQNIHLFLNSLIEALILKKKSKLSNLTPIKSEDKLRSYIRDILEALIYLHSRGIIHGDIKLENILLKTNDCQESRIPTVKLCDFGLSRIIDKNTGKAFMEFPVGSTNYMAPEIKAKTYVDEKIDIWALGVVLYKMAVAYRPTQITGFKYGSGPIPFRKIDWRKRSPELQDLIVQMLKMDPSERISADEALRHPWLQK